MFAWLMKTPLAIKQIEKISHGYLQMDCAGGKCYGVLAVSMLMRLGGQY
jgi:serine incorporator 1/3